MSELSALPSNIVEWLKTREELDYIRFLTEYPAIKKAVPLKYTTAAVGIESMEIVDSFEENDEGVLVENEYCRQAKIKIRRSIHAPYSLGGEACHDAFTDIIDCLTFASGLDIITSGCEGVISDRDTDAFVLTAWATVNASLCPATSSSLDFPSFINKELLCGSHMRDTDIHLTEEQQTYLNQPFVTGSYFGTGEASRSISLGFEPTVVLVVAGGFPMLYANHLTQENKAYAALGLRNGHSMGVEVTKSGFKVRNPGDEVVRATVPVLNEIGTTFFYLAFR
jgi:hypothetical protein